MASYFNLVLDTIAPAGVSVLIDGDAKYTTDAAVTLTLATSDQDTTGYQMKIWGDITDAADEQTAVWQTFSTEKSVTLDGADGTKTVSIKIRDDVGNESVVASDTIILDTAVPVVTITTPDKSKISKVSGFDTTVFTFSSDVDFMEYKVGVVPASSSIQTQCAVIPTTGGSQNTSGLVTDIADAYKANTPITTTIKGVDLETANSGDGTKVVKVFVRNDAGTWSVA